MTDFKIHTLWPIPLYESIIPVKKEWSETLDKIEYRRTYFDNSFISQNNYILNNFDDLKNKILEHFDKYTKDFLKIKNNVNFYLLNSWINLHKSNDTAQIHFHKNSLISGVYYLNFPKNSGNLVFCKNTMFTNFINDNISIEYDETNFINSTNHVVYPKKGNIFFFPSHLYHFVEKNLSNENRYSLAFNFFLKGKIGKNESELELK